MDNILALDLGTTTGWAIEKNGVISHGFECFKRGRNAGHAAPLRHFRKWLTDVKASFKGEDFRIVFEDIQSGRNFTGLQWLSQMMGVLTEWCEAHEIYDYEPLSIKTVKKRITGNGNAKKEDIAKKLEQMGYMVRDENEADALAVLLCAKEAH